MMMMSSWRQSCVQQSHYIMLGLTFCYSTPGMLLWAVQKHLKFPFEVKYHCQQASRRESLTLTLFSCGFFQTNPHKGFLSRCPWASPQSCSFRSSTICHASLKSKGLTAAELSGPTPKVQTMENSLLQLHQKEKQTRPRTSVPNRYKMSFSSRDPNRVLSFLKCLH